ncbi:MAG: beta-galactosidase [Oscillospiraceae bacterium]|nr:beta-galactosidase [Oscillospiraceae bacterium]
MDFTKKLQEIFPIGTKYAAYRDRTDRHWDVDFANMKRCGMDTVRVHATWGTVEPDEGAFDFDYYDRITACAVKHGLRVIFTLYLVCTPEWVYEKHPESRYTSAAGTVWTAHQQSDASTGGWPGLCYDSMPHRATVENFIRAFTEHYHGNDDIIAFDVIHEPTEEPSQQYYQVSWREMVYCYCGHSTAGFREWLKKKYGSLQRLNEVWTRQYQNWAQVHPPKSIGMYTDWLDWKYYRVDAQIDQVQWLSDTVKKYDANRCTVVHTGIYETGHPMVSSNDHFRLSKTTDMFGSSIYDPINPEMTAFVCDLLRCASGNGPYWIGEAGSGAGPMFIFVGEKPEESQCFSRSITGDDIKRQTWGQIARGAKGILYWGWRPELSTIETACLGFAERNGDLNERTDALKEFTDIFHKHKARLAKSMPLKSDTAILYNLDNCFTEGLISLGLSASPLIRPQNRFYKDTISLVGAYMLCMKNQIQADFVDKAQALGGSLKDYKLLILPYSVNITSDLAVAIEDFVKNGGAVISDGLCGYFTDDAWGAEVCPAAGLDKVFGLNVKSHYELIDELDIVEGECRYRNIAKNISEWLVVHKGAKIRAQYDDGKPAVVTNQYNKGSTAYLGTLFFANAMWNYSGDTNKMFRNLLSYVGYEPQIKLNGSEDSQNVEIRTMHDDEGAFVFVINHNRGDTGFDMQVPLGFAGQAVEIVSGSDSENVGVDGVLHTSGTLRPQEVKIFKVNRQ